MKTLKEIYQAAFKQTDKHVEFAMTFKDEQQFLALLAPLFFDYLTRLEKLVPLSLRKYVDQQLVTTRLRKDFCTSLLPLIERVCVFEMHILKEKDALLGDTPKERFVSFVHILAEAKNSLSLLEKYAVLRTYLQTWLGNYIQTSTLFWQRLENDFDVLSQKFLGAQEQVTLTHIISSGDMHNNGLFVMVLSFSCSGKEKKLVYKPRAMAMDESFNHFLTWVNRYGDMPAHYVTHVVDCENYGWCEFLSQKDCDNKEAVKRFYSRLGSLLAMLYVLNGSDIHYENVVAFGEYPVIIDLECLIQPRYFGDNAQFDHNHQATVLETGVLPRHNLARADYLGCEMGALFGCGDCDAPYHSFAWEKAGTDEMQAKRRATRLPGAQNLPTLVNEAVDPHQFSENLLQGFRHTYCLFMENKQQLLAPKGVLEKFKHVSLRVVLRNTSEYGKLLFESFHPRLLYYPDKQKSHFMWLGKPGSDLLPQLRKVVDEEVAVLRTGNIPAYYTRADSRLLYNGLDHQVDVPIVQSGYEVILETCRDHLSKQDLKKQCLLIKQSYLNHSMNESKVSLSLEQLKKQANGLLVNVLDELCEEAVMHNRYVTWISSTLEYETVHSGLMGLDLYNGVAGVGLLFLYAGVLLKREDYLQIASQVKTRLVAECVYLAKSPSLGVGAHFGYAGLLYFLAHYKAVAQDYDVDKTVSILFSLLSDAVKDDCKFDMTHGVTGCLAAIQSASLYGFQDKVNVLSERCVMHLLTGFSDPAVNPLTHATYQNKSLLGFAHGLSGMHWAVRQCYPLALTREIRHWLGKVENTLRAGFSTRYNHWPNFSKGPEHFSSYWCHGMAGFACANLSQKDNALALKTVRTHGLCHQSHNLCHGNAGNMDVLLSHNVLTADDAQAWLQGVQHALKSGQAFDGCNGLMVGKSGLAYALLRFLHPQDVPSVLKLDQPIKPS